MSRLDGRLLVVGAGGQLSGDLVRVLAGRDVVALTQWDLDITDADAVRAALAEHRPAVVFNAAAYTAVDAAEIDEDTAYAVNAFGPRLLAGAAAALGARFVHVSTDYVFAGDAHEPYDEQAPTGPRSAYGRTKLAGETAVLAADPTAYVVRTAWVYGQDGNNFVKTMARLERERETISVVDDQIGAPTWSMHLARGLVALVSADAGPGVYHCTNSGAVSWFGFTQAIFEELGADPARVLPVSTAEFPRPAPRPAYSVLGDRRWRAAGLPPMPHWRDALREAFATAGEAFRGTA